MEKPYKNIDEITHKILFEIGLPRSSYKIHPPSKKNGIYYIEFGLKNEIPLLLIHGFGATGITFFKILPELSKNFHIYLIDLIGTGNSKRPKFFFTNFKESILYFINPLKNFVEILDLENLVVVAHSYGCLIAAHLVEFVKDRILGVFFVSPAGFVDRDFTEKEKEVKILEFSEKTKIPCFFLNFLDFYIFEKKIPLFNFFTNNLTRKYIKYKINNKSELKLTEREKMLFFDYYNFMFLNFDFCAENTLWFFVKFGGYSEKPIIDVLKKNSDFDFFVYYGDRDYLDFEKAREEMNGICMGNRFRIFKGVSHVVFFENPDVFLEQFFFDFNVIYREAFC